MFSNIVVAVDGSQQSNHALATACNLASKYNSDIHLVHSPQLDTVALAVGSSAFSIQPSQDKIDAAGKTIMDAAVSLAETQGWAAKTTTIGNDDPAREVLKCVEANNADLIITGRRGLNTIASVFLGSVSNKISQEAPCACLTVK